MGVCVCGLKAPPCVIEEGRGGRLKAILFRKGGWCIVEVVGLVACSVVCKCPTYPALGFPPFLLSQYKSFGFAGFPMGREGVSCSACAKQNVHSGWYYQGVVRFLLSQQSRISNRWAFLVWELILVVYNNSAVI